MHTHATTVVMPRQPGTAARMVAVFALGAVSAGGLIYAIMARSTPAVAPAAMSGVMAPMQPVSQPMPPIVVQLVQPPVAPTPAGEPATSALVGPPAPAAVAIAPAARPVTTEVVPEATTPSPVMRPVTSPVTSPGSSVTSPVGSPLPGGRGVTAKVNLNTATQAELEALPLVGPSMAKRIIEHRTKSGPFRQVKDLDKVKGVGEKTLARLMPLVCVDAAGDR